MYARTVYEAFINHSLHKVYTGRVSSLVLTLTLTIVMKTLLLGALAALAAVAVPGVSFAQTYAYVNQQGEVMTTEADTPTEAINTAPAIDEHSGVLHIDGADDSSLVGDDVPGV